MNLSLNYSHIEMDQQLLDEKGYAQIIANQTTMYLPSPFSLEELERTNLNISNVN